MNQAIVSPFLDGLMVDGNRLIDYFVPVESTFNQKPETVSFNL
jgi:hypothetical protein